jgi:predicted metal-binding protein
MIFIGFRRQIGRDDVLGIEEYLKVHKEFEEVYIVYKESLSEVVKEMIEKKQYRTVQTGFLKKTLKELRNKGRNKAFFLDDFGRRKLRNPCGRTLSRPQYW